MKGTIDDGAVGHGLEQNTAATSVTPDPQTNALLAQLMFVQLRKVGVFEGHHCVIEEQKRRLLPLYGRWLEESVRVLVRHGYLREQSNGYAIDQAPEPEAVWKTWEQTRAQQREDSQWQAQTTLVDAMVRALPE